LETAFEDAVGENVIGKNTQQKAMATRDQKFRHHNHLIKKYSIVPGMSICIKKQICDLTAGVRDIFVKQIRGAPDLFRLTAASGWHMKAAVSSAGPIDRFSVVQRPGLI